MFKHLLFLILSSVVFQVSFAQRIPDPRMEKKFKEKAAKRERINEILRHEEEGGAFFKKHTLFGLAMNHDGYSVLFERGKSKSAYNSTIFQLELSEKQHVKEQKQTNVAQDFGFFFFNRPFVYAKQNIFYQAKLGLGKQIMIGGKGNKNGVGVYAVFIGGFSAGLARPYYLDVYDDIEVVKMKYSEADRNLFLDPTRIVGGTGLRKGWNEMKFNPGVYAKTGLRFDWGRFNQVVSALEFGFSFDYYSQQVVQMVDVQGRNFFPTGYVGLVFGNRK
ncbi:MAG: hypothetical protein ACK5AO_00230 [bacterium]|jgi:hypothetical protein